MPHLSKVDHKVFSKGFSLKRQCRSLWERRVPGHLTSQIACEGLEVKRQPGIWARRRWWLLAFNVYSAILWLYLAGILWCFCQKLIETMGGENDGKIRWSSRHFRESNPGLQCISPKRYALDNPPQGTHRLDKIFLHDFSVTICWFPMTIVFLENVRKCRRSRSLLISWWWQQNYKFGTIRGQNLLKLNSTTDHKIPWLSANLSCSVTFP